MQDTESTEPKRASAAAITTNLVVAGLGTGILTLPWGTAGASIATSLLLMFPVFLLNGFTMMILIETSHRYHVFSLGGLLYHLPGGVGAPVGAAVNAMIFSAQFLQLLGYVVVIVDSVVLLLPQDSVLSSRGLWASMVAVIVLPLCLLDQRHLAFTSTLSILANIYVIGLLVFYAAASGSGQAADVAEVQPLCVFGITRGVATQFSLIMYSLLFHITTLPMYRELENRSVKKFGKCLVVALFCTFFILASVMISGYVAFGPTVNSNVLNNLPVDLSSSVARIAMVICILGIFPIFTKAMLVPVAPPKIVDESATNGETPLLQCDSRKDFQLSRLETTMRSGVIVLAVTICSLWVRELGPLNAIIGGMQVVSYVGVLPGVCGLFLLDRTSTIWRAAMLGLVLFAVVACLVAFLNTENRMPELVQTCLWAWHN